MLYFLICWDLFGRIGVPPGIDEAYCMLCSPSGCKNEAYSFSFSICQWQLYSLWIYNLFLSFELWILSFLPHWRWETILNLAFVLIFSYESLFSVKTKNLFHLEWGKWTAFSSTFEKVKSVLESWLGFLVKMFPSYAIKNNSTAI